MISSSGGIEGYIPSPVIEPPPAPKWLKSNALRKRERKKVCFNIPGTRVGPGQGGIIFFTLWEPSTSADYLAQTSVICVRYYNEPK